jgi:hypothetical protein
MFRLTLISKLLLAVLLGLVSAAALAAGEPADSCYRQVEHPAEDLMPQTSLYVVIDQTTPLTKAMQADIRALVERWFVAGAQLRIARLSANTQGQYAELMFDDYLDVVPGDYLLFNLRRKDKRVLENCLKTRRDNIRREMLSTLNKTLAMNSAKLPKTELIHTLQRFSQQLIGADPIQDKTLLLVSDGLENSPLFSFHSGKSIKVVDPAKSLQTVRKAELIADWRGSEVYVYGLGHLADTSVYVTPKLLAGLQAFWKDYFSAGGAEVMEIGMPALLQTSQATPRP